MPNTSYNRQDSCRYPEGIVHGHIHNYDNMTYIHGHLHRTYSDAASNANKALSAFHSVSTADKVSVSQESSRADNLAVPTPVKNEAIASSKPSIENCTNYSDCQHFEIINYHRTDDIKNSAKRRESYGKQNLPPGSSIFNDEFLLPPNKRRFMQNNISGGYASYPTTEVFEGENCECSPKILEVCCDVRHPNDSSIKEQKDKDLVIYTEVKNDNFLQSALNNLGHKNDVNLENANNVSRNDGITDQMKDGNSSNPNVVNQYFSNITEIPEINCDLTCGPTYHHRNERKDCQDEEIDIESDIAEEEEEDIFEKFCKECLNLGHDQTGGTNCFSSLDSHSHFHHSSHNCNENSNHNHHFHKNSFDTPLSTSSTSSHESAASIKLEKNFCNDVHALPPASRKTAEGLSTTLNNLSNANPISSSDSTFPHTKSCHDHIVNSQTDLKILDELCNISSLYEFPQANHLNHHNHSHIHVSEGDQSPKKNESQSQCVNLIKSSLTGTTAQCHKPNETHHHHIIQLHPHKPNCSTDCVLGRDSDNLTSFNNFVPESVQYNNRNYSNERSTAQENTMINGSNASSAKFHHSQKPVNLNSLIQENSTIDFNWSFKNEENALKCKWDQCPDTYSTLLDLQKHMLRDHVSMDSSTDLSCYWENCNFQGDDTCSLINHINADHGINFGMRIVDPVSLLELKESNDYQSHDCNNLNFHNMTLNSDANPIQEKQLPSMYHNEGNQCHYNSATCSNPSHSREISRTGTFQCKWGDCKEDFLSAEALTTHLEQVHLTRGKSEYQCDWEGCSKKFTQRQKLVRHLKVHSGYKPYKCSICSKCFSSEDTLTQHMRIHSGEKPFACPICGKKFTVSSSLKIHIRTHTGEKPLQCKICGKRFNESSNLSKHMKTHQKKYKCIFCARSFDTIERFNGHQNKCAKAHDQQQQPVA